MFKGLHDVVITVHSTIHSTVHPQENSNSKVKLYLKLDGGELPVSCPDHLNPGKSPQYALNRRLGGSQSWCRHFREDRNLLLFPERETWFLSFFIL